MDTWTGSHSQDSVCGVYVAILEEKNSIDGDGCGYKC